VKNINYEAPHYIIFSVFLIIRSANVVRNWG